MKVFPKPMPSNSKITIISFSPIHQDARVLRQIDSLAKRYSVTVIGYGHLETLPEFNVQMCSIPTPTGLVRHLRALILLLLGRIFPDWAYEAWYWGKANHQGALKLLRQCEPQIIHANEWSTLPLAVRVSQQTGAQVILDLHEYSPLDSEDKWFWRTLYKPMIVHFLRKYTPHVSASVTVNDSIAEKYAQEYSLQPIVVMNISQSAKLPDFRQTNPNHIRLIHHGAAISNRKLELMIETISKTDSRYTLHFMLIELSRGYVSDLQLLAQRLAPDRVFFHAPVPPAEIVDRIAEFDLGIFILPFINFNHAVALPNKFFDFITAGLAVCIGPSPEMARLTEKFGFGVVVPSFEPTAVAQTLNSLSIDDLDRMKSKAIEARKILNIDEEMGKLVSLYTQLLSTTPVHTIIS